VVALRTAHPRLSIRHRTEAYRFMLTTHAAETGLLVAVKGNPLEVLELCRRELLSDGTYQPLDPERRAAIERSNMVMADGALRVLGFAFAEVDESGAAAMTVSPSASDGLVWVGLAGLADPLRPGMRELMGLFHKAGIHTVMVTGDQGATARRIAEQLGLNTNGEEIEVLDTADLQRLPPDELAAAARRAHAFARVSPAQKLQIVRALQHAGLTVAMTGDGVNDSPALKAADVGIALGRSGTEAARGVADVVLQTDDLMALAIAVERGRTTYGNVRKAIRYLLSTNLSEILVVLAATATGIGEPLSPMQLLWINLISDVFPALCLAFEPPEAGAMECGPRSADKEIIRPEDLGALAEEAAIIGAGALAACVYGVLRYGAASDRTRTMTFTSLITAQLLHALTCRTAGRSTPLGAKEALPPNTMLAGGLAISFAVQLLTFLVPGLRRLLDVVPIGPLDALVTAAAGALPYLANEALKTERSSSHPGR
jgi:Ca2+-transporting ATPase